MPTVLTECANIKKILRRSLALAAVETAVEGDLLEYAQKETVFPGQNPWSELAAMRTSASDRGGARHDKSVGVVEDDSCCFRGG
jgi:hypothetical protein